MEAVNSLGMPIIVYITGRLLEQGLRALYNRWRPELVFSEEIDGQSAALTIRTNSKVFLDDLMLHLQDKPIDLLDTMRSNLGITKDDRLEFDVTDKIRLTCWIQVAGDKRLFLHALMGKKIVDSVHSLTTYHKSAESFMRATEISIETSKRKYSRKLLASY